MTYFTIALMMFTFAIGAMVRDGYPGFKPLTNGVLGTHAARLTGAMICALGVLPFGLELTGWVFLGIWLGFYFDMKHGEATGVDTPTAWGDAFLSGLTSFVPLIMILGWFHPSSYTEAILAASLMKPGVWWLAWKLPQGTFWYGSRVAAMSYYVLMAPVIWWVL